MQCITNNGIPCLQTWEDVNLLRSVQEIEGPGIGGGFQFPPCGKTEDIPGIGIRDLVDHGPDGTDEDMDHFSTRPLTAMMCMFISVLISVATSLSQICPEPMQMP